MRRCLVWRKTDACLLNCLCVDYVRGGVMILPEGLELLLALVILGASIAALVAIRKRTSRIAEADWGSLPSEWRTRRSAEDAAYERWKREGGGAWFDSWWDSPEAAPGKTRKATPARPEVPGRMSTEEARRKLDGLLELTVARGATPAEAATARAIAERLKAEYDLS
jgi:uncharacterized protein DUF2786